MLNSIVNRVKRATPLVVGETPPDTLEETVHVEAALRLRARFWRGQLSGSYGHYDPPGAALCGEAPLFECAVEHERHPGSERFGLDTPDKDGRNAS